MIANVNLLAFTFGNGRDAVNNARDGIERILTNIIEFDCHIQEVVNTETDGLTNVQTYFVNNENTPVHKDVISAMVNVQETFNELRNSFSTIGLNLKTVEVNAATTETDMESVLQTILIVVSVVLGTLVIVLFAAFFFRTRR
ncbi:hypothetical protein C0J52_23137 [Blattella germanica]|nr:hypothetical protein C0J52_23137 [Blattella germanica]